MRELINCRRIQTARPNLNSCGIRADEQASTTGVAAARLPVLLR
jgi:hypothetical protein